MDHGFGEVAAASLLATIGVFDLVGTLCSGWLTDWYDPQLLLAWYYGLRGLSLLALPYVFESPRFGLILFVWAFSTSGLLCLFAVGLVTQIRRGPELVPVPAPA
jgi:predicted MFS family arabinose efflux permease